MAQIAAGPVQQTERIVILDSLRGIAILGILMMNIPGFAMPLEFVDNPLILHEQGTRNYMAWFFVDWFLEGSQRALFSMLFGAGTILFVSRLEKRLPGLQPADYYFRRQLWLLLFGLFNAYVLLWFWDILFVYALYGMIIFTFRKLPPKALLIAAVLCLVLQTARENVGLYREKAMIARGEKLAAMDTTVNKLTEKQKGELTAMTESREEAGFEAQKKKGEKALNTVRGNYGEFYRYQSERSYEMETGMGFYGIWDVLLFMFLGMAFYKSGILTGDAPAKTYWLLFAGGLGIGLLLSWLRLKPMIDAKFNHFVVTKNIVIASYELSRSFRAVGIFGLIMLLYKSGWFKWLFALLRPVGQMAFTNYLMQSLLCGLFFYGVGFGMFGKLERFEIYYVVLSVWIFQIIFCHLWLRFFRLGPLEWAWRSLTYWQWQPLKKRPFNE